MTVERAHELAELEAMLAGAAAGRGRVALVTGPLACGKSELLDAFAERALTQGAVLLSAAASPAEQDLPWAVAGQLRHGLDLPGVPPPGGGDGAAAAQRLGLALLELSAEQPVVVCVDDVQFVDGPSLLTLLAVQRRVRAHRVLMVLTTGTHHHRRTPADGWTELLRGPGLTTLRIGPLSVDSVAALLSTRWGVASAASAAAYHAASGGSPLLLHGLIGDAPATAPAGAETGVPPAGWAFRHAVLACLDRADSTLLATAQALALLGPGATAENAARLLGLGPADAVRCRDVLVDAGLLDGHGFRHPEGRRVVLDTIGTADRAGLHLRAAEQARDAGADCTTVAGHLVGAGRAPHDWAPAVLVAAAEQALVMDRVDDAVQCLRLALTECAEPRRKASLTALLAWAQWRQNPASALRHLDTLCRAADAGQLSRAETVQLVRYLTWHGRVETAYDVLDGVDARGDAGSADWLTELRAVYQYVHHSLVPLAGRVPGADPAPAPRRGAPPEPPGPDEITRAAEQVLTGLVLEDHTVEAAAGQLSALAYAGRADRAADWCDDLLAQVTNSGALTARAQLTAVRAELALRLGDLPGAEATARQALDLLPPSAWGVVAGSPLAVLVLALVRLGRLDEAAEHLRFRVPAAIFETRFGAQYLHARGHHHLAGGRALRAYADFERCGAVMTELGLDRPAFVPWRAGLALACLALDRQDTAHDLATEQLRRLSGWETGVRGDTLRVLAATTDLRRRPALLRESVDLLQSGQDQATLVAALVDLSDTCHQLGEFSRARMTARQARERAAAIGAEAICANLLSADTAEPAARQRPAADRDVAVLSDAEWRVASLAAFGHTNTEISRKLFITVSTVEQHLTRVYRKLKVARRGDLPTILHATDAVDIA